jgi:hypothetical protein
MCPAACSRGVRMSRSTTPPPAINSATPSTSTSTIPTAANSSTDAPVGAQPAITPTATTTTNPTRSRPKPPRLKRCHNQRHAAACARSLARGGNGAEQFLFTLEAKPYPHPVVNSAWAYPNQSASPGCRWFPKLLRSDRRDTRRQEQPPEPNQFPPPHARLPPGDIRRWGARGALPLHEALERRSDGSCSCSCSCSSTFLSDQDQEQEQEHDLRAVSLLI